MKKEFFLTILAACAITMVNAQILTKEMPVKKKSTVKSIPPPQVPPPAPAPAPAPSAKTTPPQNSTTTPDQNYILTSVKVNIQTGDDNKESPSKIAMHLLSVGGKQFLYQKRDISYEFKSNSNTECMLDKQALPYFYELEDRLDKIQKEGLTLQLFYNPNFILDAWKIESITVILEFKDKFSNLHPTLGTKVIPFINSSMLLTNKTIMVNLPIDKFLMPQAIEIIKTK